MNPGCPHVWMTYCLCLLSAGLRSCAITPGLSAYHTDFQSFFFLNLFISQARELFLKAVEEEQNGALYEGKTQLLNCSSLAISIHLCWNLFGIEHSPPTTEVTSLN